MVASMPVAAPRYDVHQHLWPTPFLHALAARTTAPNVVRDGRDGKIRVPGEPDSGFAASTHDALTRREALRCDGLDVALLCTSTPLGVEFLPEDQARPLLDAWHEGVLALGGAFGFWGALPVHGAAPDDVDALLDRGAVGISLPAPALAGPRALHRLGPVLERLEHRGAPLLVHPGPVNGSRPAAADADDLDAPWWPALTGYVADQHVAWHAFLATGRAAHPDLRVCFAMLAGLAPLHAERLAKRGGPADAVADRGLFYDTSSYGPRAISGLAAVVGPGQLVFGSDRPVVSAAPADSASGSVGPALADLVNHNVHRLLHSVPSPEKDPPWVSPSRPPR
jgi:hypothetical protein